MGTLCAQLLLQLHADSFEYHRCFGHSLKKCMWFGYIPQIIFCHFFCNSNLVFFQALLLSTYVDSVYLVRVTPPTNFTFSDDSYFFKKNLGGGHTFSEFACRFRSTPMVNMIKSIIMKLGKDHQGLKVYEVYINDIPCLTLTYFSARANFVKIGHCA